LPREDRLFGGQDLAELVIEERLDGALLLVPAAKIQETVVRGVCASRDHGVFQAHFQTKAAAVIWIGSYDLRRPEI